jgi:hypothetical protein
MYSTTSKTFLNLLFAFVTPHLNASIFLLE